MDSIHSILQAHHAAAQAALMRKYQSLDLAEEALQEASLRALSKWPQQGVPGNVTAWLVRTGINATIDQWRRQSRFQPFEDSPEQTLVDDSAGSSSISLSASLEDKQGEYPTAFSDTASSLGDDVLNLIFLCAHPAIAVENQLAMVLKMVMGFSQTEVARALLISEKTLEQRLTRAKRKISHSGISFELSPNADLSLRQKAVMQSLYLIFNEGYSSNGGESLLNYQLCRQAINMTRILCRHFPEPECLGLLALMLFQSSREEARLDDAGMLVTLDKQQRERWDKSKIHEADVLIQKALRRGKPGPYQLQAAIAAVHAQAVTAGDTDWLQIVGLYRRLLQEQPSPVIQLNYAVAVMFAGDVNGAKEIMSRLGERLDSYSSFHAAMAKLHHLQNRMDEQQNSLRRAAELAGSQQEKRHYHAQIKQLE